MEHTEEGAESKGARTPEGAGIRSLRRKPSYRPVRDIWLRLIGIQGGNVLYGLSALFVLYGASKILQPLGADTGLFREALACIAILNLYELTLLGVMLLIVLWRNVTDDAVVLVVLAGVMLVASGVALNCISTSSPWITIFLGAASLITAAGKLWAMRRHIGLPFSRLILGGMGLLLGWNFMGGGLLALLTHEATALGGTARITWQTGWFVILAGALIAAWSALNSDGAGLRIQAYRAPFLRTRPMAWVLILVVLIGMAVNQHSLAFVFDVGVRGGDYILLITPLALLVLAFLRVGGKDSTRAVLVVGSLPAAAVMFFMVVGGLNAGRVANPGILWYPPVFLAVNAVILLVAGIRFKVRPLVQLVPLYLGFSLLTSRFTPAHPFDLEWTWTAGGVAAVFSLMGIIRRKAYYAWAGMAAAVLFLAPAAPLSHTAAEYGLGRSGLTAGFIWLGTVLISAFFRKEMPAYLLLLGGIGGLVLAVDYMPYELSFQDPALILVTGLVSGFMWMVTRKQLACTACAGLIAYRTVFVFGQVPAGWRYILISFILLAVGAAVSLHKGRRMIHFKARTGSEPSA